MANMAFEVELDFFFENIEFEVNFNQNLIGMTACSHGFFYILFFPNFKVKAASWLCNRLEMVIFRKRGHNLHRAHLQLYSKSGDAAAVADPWQMPQGHR